MIGNTVCGVLLKDRDLLTVPLDELMALNMASVECSEGLISETPFEIAKAEAEKWRRSASQALDALYSVQSDLDKIQRVHAEEPTRNLAEIPLPEGNGANSGVTYAELQIRRQALQLRQQNLKAGSTFWSHVYFEIIVTPTSDLAPLDSLPASSRGLALQSADHLQDMLRWTLGRFGRLQDVCGDTNFMTQVAESEGNTKLKFSEMSEKLVDLSNGLVGLASSLRHTQDEQLKASRQATKSLGDIGWQLSGAGKGVNTSVKESLLSLGKLLSQIDSNVGRQSKAQEETNSLLKNLNTLMMWSSARRPLWHKLPRQLQRRRPP